MLPFADAMRPAKSNHRYDQQAFDTASVCDVGIFKVKAATL
jgi:hypothetical protein